MACDVCLRCDAARKHTVTFLMTDGDNIQWLLSGFASGPAWFGSPDRGKVAMGWTISPALAELAPNVMGYIYDHAHAGADQVCGPSPPLHLHSFPLRRLSAPVCECACAYV